MKNLAIIPARSGSKGLKDKNIKIFNGKPLIWYSVQAALQSEMFDEVMVSTDSEKYGEIALKCGANVPFLRSQKTASDTSSSWDSVREVVENYRNRGRTFDNIMLLQPTSPLRHSGDIINAFEIFEKNNADSVVSVCEVEHSPLWCNVLPEDGSLDNFFRSELNEMKRRQDLPVFYRMNGAIYLIKVVNCPNIELSLYNKSSYAYRMPQIRSIDIDNELDFYMAEYIMKNKIQD